MTISLRLDQHLARRVEAAAQAKGISKSELIRRCLQQHLEEEQLPSAWELGKHLFGCYASDRGDLSERGEEIVGDLIRAKHAARRHR